MDIIAKCDKVIRYSFYALFIIVPLILTPWNYELFEFNKMIVTYALTFIIATAWVMKMAINRKIEIRKTPLDIPIILFVLSQLISSFFSMDPHVSWFGYYSRFNGGMLSIFSYVVLYYAFVTNWTTSLLPIIYSLLGSSILVAIYGVLEHFGIDKDLWVQDVQNRVFSTLGQPNWLAAYLVSLMPISLHFAIRMFPTNTKHKSFMPFVTWTSVYTLLFITLLFTRSRSGMFGLFIATVIYFAFSIFKSTQRKNFVMLFAGVNLIAGLFLFFNGSNIDAIDKYVTLKSWQTRLVRTKDVPTETVATPSATTQTGTLLEYGGTESGTIRKFVWEAALNAWRSTQKTFFIGTGTETFAFAFFQYKPIAHNLTSEWDFLYNKAHNEYLNYLATTGIFGLGSYMLMLGAFIVWFIRVLIRDVETDTPQHPTLHFLQHEHSLSLALFAGWVSILVTNFFGFSVVIVQVLLFLFPAIIVINSSLEQKRTTLTNLPGRMPQVLMFIGFFVGAIGVCYVGIMWFGDYYFSMGYRDSRQGKLSTAYQNLTQAVLLRPNEPMYYDELGVVLGNLSVASLEVGNATAASDLAQQSLASNDRALTISPNNVNYWKSRTKIYFGFADLDTKFVAAARDSLEKAYALSPNDPKITYNLAVLEGRLGNNEKAIDILKKTVVLKPNYRDAYYALNIFYDQVSQPELSKAILEEYLKKVDPNDKEFLEKIQ